jgi:hypothetical protein
LQLARNVVARSVGNSELHAPIHEALRTLRVTLRTTGQSA